MCRLVSRVCVLAGFLAPCAGASPPAKVSLAATRLEASSQPAAATPTAPAALDSASLALRDKVRRALAINELRPINARDNSPWEIMHWIIAYNVRAEVCTEGPSGERVTAVGWLCANRPCRGLRLLDLRADRVAGQRGPGVQGHDAQFLAILAQSGVPADYPLRVGGQEFTVADLVKSEQLACRGDRELTFTLIGLAHYLPSDAAWKSDDGEAWNIPRLVREELRKPLRGAPCGGTHRLMGLSYAVRMRERRGEPVDGEHLRARAFVEQYHRQTLGMQNPDGSFSTAWLAGREARRDVERRLQTSGHILEWLAFSLSDDELRDPRVLKAVGYLAGILIDGQRREWDVGPLGHALRALSLYDRRVYRPLETASAPAADGAAAE